MLPKRDPTLPCQYIGQTSRTLRERFGEHRRGIQNNTDESVPIRLSMEQLLIEKAGTLQNGINRTCDH